MKTSIMIAAAALVLGGLVSCEMTCPDCPPCSDCELEHLGENTEWGEKVKAELMTLFLDIEDLALVRVFNTSGDSLIWSGFDAGNPEEDSRQIQVDFMETDLVLVFKRFVEGYWTHSLIRIPYNSINATVLQIVKFVQGGSIYRRANNVLIFISDSEEPYIMEGSQATAQLPDGLEETGLREIFSR